MLMTERNEIKFCSLIFLLFYFQLFSFKQFSITILESDFSFFFTCFSLSLSLSYSVFFSVMQVRSRMGQHPCSHEHFLLQTECQGHRSKHLLQIERKGTGGRDRARGSRLLVRSLSSLQFFERTGYASRDRQCR